MSKDFQEQIEELLICNICYECLTKPKTLVCGHTFCLHCLEQLLVKEKERNAANGGSEYFNIRCPTCRTALENITTREDLLILDAPLYVKQSLGVLEDHRTRKTEEVNEYHDESGDPNNDSSVNNLLENCFVCGEDGHWQNSCKEMGVEKGHDNVEIVDFNLKGTESCEDSEILMLTQELTFGKIFKKIFSHKNNKSEISGEQSLVGYNERGNANWKNVDKNTKCKEQQPKYFPKYICHTTAVTGLGLKPKYVPGSLVKTKAVPAMVCQGLYLNQHNDSSSKQTPVTRRYARQDMKKDSKFIQGPFGYVKKPCFLLPKASRKVIFAVKF